MSVIHFTKEGFERACAQPGVVLVDFWAGWCGPCKMIAPVIEKLAEQYAGRVTVGKVDVDQESALAQQFGVMSIPNVVILKNGEVVDRKVGAMPLSAYTDALDQVLSGD